MSRATVASSLALSPFVIFISTANLTFLNNQTYFPGEFKVYIPFVILFFVTWSIGAVLYRYSRLPFARRALWAYYFAGPLFLIIAHLRRDYTNLPMSCKALVLLPFLAVFGAVALKARPRRWAGVFSLWAVGVVLVDILIFVNSEIGQRVSPKAHPLIDLAPRTSVPQLPNVYHLLFDGYQTDLLLEQLDPGLARELAGFVLFPKNVSSYQNTEMSVAAVVTGRLFDYTTSIDRYLSTARDSEETLTHLLEMIGYRTVGFQHVERIKVFDRSVVYTEYSFGRAVKASVHDGRIFNRLWLSSFVPRSIREAAVDLRLIESASAPLLSSNFPISSYDAFSFFTDNERRCSDSNRYTFFHAIIPHSPFILDADCEVREHGSQMAELHQARCATKLLVDFVTELKRLGRFEDSLIIAHGDHGSSHPPDSALTTRMARSRALLLIKLPGVYGSQDALRISDRETTLLDIAPTLLDAVGSSPEAHYEGLSLVDHLSSDDGSPISDRSWSTRKRYYHEYDYDNWRGERSIRSVTRFLAHSNGELVYDKRFVIEDAPSQRDE